MEKHVPMHPLPEEIQMMPRDETVCKYCGVSYLILHEFKLLEDKVKALEKKLHFYQGSEEREKRLQEELQFLRQEHEQSKTDSKSIAERLRIALLQLKEKETKLQAVTTELTTYQQAVRAAQDQEQLLREKAAKQEAILRKSQLFLRLLQSEQTAVRKNVQVLMGHWNDIRRDISSQIEETVRSYSAEMISRHARLEEFQIETLSLQNQVKNLQAIAESVTLTSKQLQDSREKETELKNKCLELEKQILDLQQQLETVRTDFHNVTKEMQHHKDISIIKTKEANDFHNKLQGMEFDKEAIILKLKKDLKENNEAVTDSQQKCKQLQEEITEVRRTGEHFRKRTHHLENELETTKEVLKQSKEEVAHMKHEREVQIVSYQNRIDQLQEALKQRMLSEDSWERKIQNELENEHQKYLLKLEETKKQLREEANMELEIERQKHEEMLNSFRNRSEALEGKIPSLISQACDELYAEVTMLEKKLHEAQTRLTEKDQGKEREVTNLKKIVSELELRLTREQDHDISALEEMRKDIRTKAEKLKELNLNCAELRLHLDQATREIEFLKETVRMECEERYELTEALTQAKQQLLEIKRVGGSFSLSHRTLTADKPASALILPGAQKKAPQGLPTTNGTKLMSLSGSYGPASATNYNKLRQSGGSSSLPLLQSPHPPKERTSSLTDTRHKITAILRRNSTQP
ncbi:protein LEKR1 isoform X2 [Phyllobates terribilis]|uniref:protein LEKR1 isoform X2 n=1 Tax=Phyllobates terribilis TaxID=111132 RepID=UPI003CCAB5A2